MHVEIKVRTTDLRDRVFLHWVPVQASIALRDAAGVNTLRVTLRNGGAVGQVLFDRARSDSGTGTLELDLPGDGTPLEFWVAGDPDAPSRGYGDASIQVVGPAAAGGVIGDRPLMVRVRKDAQTLSAPERDAFVSAFAAFNDRGSGRFRDFRDAHLDLTSDEAHGDWGFLPWHRAFLLDLERELQAIDPVVSLHYWRFDRPAPAVFSQDFMGVSNAQGRVTFRPGHPFQFWTTENVLGIDRTLLTFDAATAPGSIPVPGRPAPMNERDTLRLGGSGADYAQFIASLEGNPHGRAHMSFDGFLSEIDQAARDPLFFMLHCNVDRLWARWQFLRDRSDPANRRSYPSGQARVGHSAGDTMWPWNGIVGDPRPPTAPGGGLCPSSFTSAPGTSPTTTALLDIQGLHGGADLGFSYADVPFDLTPGGAPIA